MKAAVIGLGYVGSVTAAGLAAGGHDVAVCDVDRTRVAAFLDGHPQVDEPGLGELIERGRGRLRAAATCAEAIAGVRVALVCVQTPAAPQGAIDLSHVEAVVREIVAAADQGPLTIALRSTVVPGSTDRMDAAMLASARTRGKAIDIAANPEFLREGRAVADFVDADRIVVGSSSTPATEALAELYRHAGAPVMTMTAASAELAKYASNALLATLISFSNEIADLAETVEDADVVDALAAIQADRRWRETEGQWSPAILSYLWPGCGYGGSCLPKDVKALVAEGRRRGLDMALVRAVDAINERRGPRLVRLIGSLTALAGTSVAVLGTAFKEGTRDERSSPGLALAQELRRAGAQVVTYDPLSQSDPARARGLDEVLRGSRVWVVVTGAREFEDLPRRSRDAGAVLVDARRRYAADTPDRRIAGPGRSSGASRHAAPRPSEA